MAAAFKKAGGKKPGNARRGGVVLGVKWKTKGTKEGGTWLGKKGWKGGRVDFAGGVP